MNASDINTAILNGEVDGQLDSIFAALRLRQDQIASRTRATLKAGDRVVLNNNCGTRYLRGQQATIVRKLQKNFLVELDTPMGRFDRPFRCPPALLTKVEA